MTKEEWEEKFEHLDDDLCEQVFENGDRMYSAEGFNEWLDRVINMPDLPEEASSGS